MLIQRNPHAETNLHLIPHVHASPASTPHTPRTRQSQLPPPYPTYTPAPLPPMERTATPRPRYTPAPTAPLPPMERTASLNCDNILKNQLTFQRGANTAHRMNIVISQIQAQKQGCEADLWNPTVVDLSTDVGNCYGNIGTVAAGANQTEASKKSKVGDANMPNGLLVWESSAYSNRTASGRDNENNIIIYFNLDPPKRPADGASCWLYHARLRQWHKNFHTVTVGEESSTPNLPATPTRPTPTRPDIPSTQELPEGTQTPPTSTSVQTPLTSTPIHSPTAKDVIPEWAYKNHPSLTEYILNLPWASKKLTAFEINTVELLVRYAVIYSNGIEYAINENLLVEPDPFAIDIIKEFGSFFESAPEVTDPRQIEIERRLINLPLRGQTNLLILRAQPGSTVTMDLLENAVRSAERFMEIPFPTNQVTLGFTKLNVSKGYGGSFSSGTPSSGQIHILPKYDQHALMTTHYSPGNEKRSAEVIAHEVAHYYWHHHIDWINEGMAETLTLYIEHDRVGTPIASSKPPIIFCAIYRSIIELEIDPPKKSDTSKFICNYSMGESLFLDLRNILGNQEFIQSVRRLYQTRTAPHIKSVKSAFPNSGEAQRVINQHYYGDPNPKSIKPSPQLPTIQLTSASLHLERQQTLPPWDKTPLRSISASKYYGPIVLHVTTPPHGPGADPHLTLTVKHAESDWGEQRIIEAATLIGSTTISSHGIGPRRTPWLPGNYLTSIEQQGKKLAEISWTVTP